MANYYGISNTEWARALVTSMAEFLPQVENETMRNHKFLALLKSKGRISYNNGGRGFTWQVKHKLAPTEGNNGETVRQFVRRNYWQKAELNWRGFQCTDAITNAERDENKGPGQIIDVMKGFRDRLKESIEYNLNLAWLPDGNATGNELVWHGLESMFATNGTVTITTGAQRSANAADIVGYPNDTYAGLSTVLGNYGGDQESTEVWPNGNADPEYDFWSPLVVNTLSTAFAPSTHTFAGQGDDVMRYAITQSYRNVLGGKQMDTFLLSRNLFMDFKNLADPKEQITVGPTNGLKALGFKDVIIFDGIEVTFENTIPSTVGYGLNMGNVELRCMHGSIIEASDDDIGYNRNTQALEAAVVHRGNLKFQSPRNFVKLQPTTSF